jgi:NAD(P)-dependent dehydrogenase (short-subunit alcohol dehydrogenase family)
MTAMEHMKDRICLVTGATTGIGQATARGLAGMGAHVVLACRDSQRGEQARRDIRQATGNDRLDLLCADLSSQAAIHRLAREFHDKYPCLHVLVNNAGTYADRRMLTEDGLEYVFAVNFVAPFQLTNLLLDCLRAGVTSAAGTRIVNVSSRSHDRASLNFENLRGDKRYFGFRAYAQSKLALILWTFELARRLHGSGVTVNCLCPGYVATQLVEKNSGPLASLAWKVIKWFAVTAERGARTSLYLASSPEVEGKTGAYFIDCREALPSRAARDETLAKRLWEVTEALTS